MVQGLNKEYIFKENYYKDKYINLIKKYIKKYNVLLLSYCIMDNHAHLLFYTEQISQLSMFMQNINSKFALYYNKDITRVGYVFRGRYNSQYINNKEYLLNCLNYIHMNPVNANIVKKPEEYKYSTYNNYLKNNGIVNDKVIDKIFGNKNNYLERFINISSEEIEVMDIDREQENFMVAVRKYIEDNKTDIENIKKDKKLIKDFCNYLVIEKRYKQVQVADLLNYDIKKIYYIIKKIKKTKLSPS